MPDPSPAVLVVDDQESPRRCLVRVLEHRGCRVLAAADGLRFADAEPALLCVFLDLSMPRMGGAEVLRRLRAAGRDTPVVLMSGFSEAEGMAAARGFGAVGWLAKPFGVEQVVAALAAVIG